MVLPKNAHWSTQHVIHIAKCPCRMIPWSNEILLLDQIQHPPPHQTYEVVSSFLLSELLLLPMSRQAATPHGGHLFRCVISWTLEDKYRMSQMPKEVRNRISWKRIFFVAYRHVYSINHTGATWGSSVQMFDVMHSSFLENGVSMLWSAKMGKRGFSFRQSFLAGRGNQEEWWVNLHILILGVYQW